jgi:hypothetical protein
MSYYGKHKLICGYCNGKRVSFEYNILGLELLAISLEQIASRTLAELSEKKLNEFFEMR